MACAQNTVGPDAEPLDESNDRRMLILYGSETGNSQDSAEDIERLAERLHFKTWLCEMNEVDLVSLRLV
jgi:sulfite reductase alpha subunit-like flavoprotein